MPGRKANFTYPALLNNKLNEQLWGQNHSRPEDHNPFADPTLFRPFGVANDNNNANPNQYPNPQIAQAQAWASAQGPAPLQRQFNADPFDIWWQPPVPNVAHGGD